MRIYMDDAKAIRPKRVMTARQVPLHLRKDADTLVQSLLDGGIIVPVTEPTDWISPGHFVPKPNGTGVRLVTDYTALNRFVRRPVHPFPSTRDILQSLSANAKVYAKMDAVHGYFQIPLDLESSMLTTFLLPSGRYRYTRAPMGLNASSDEWCRRSDMAFHGHEGTSKIVDDGLTQGADLPQLRTRLIALLEDCKKEGITLSLKKFAISRQVKFAGHLISDAGVQPDPEKVAALVKFPRPVDITSLRSFLGLANQLGAFLPDLSQALEPLRLLLKKDTAWLWLELQENAFKLAKKLLTGEMLVRPFDCNLSTELYTDASRLNGLGYMLIQREKDGSHRLIKCGSRCLLPAESRYATIELECLAIVFAVLQSSFYLQGADFTVITDHRPLLGIFSKDLAELTNPRLLRFREKLQGFVFNIRWAEGKRHLMADALSRYPVFSPKEGDDSAAIIVASCAAIQNIHDFAGLKDPAHRSVILAKKEGKLIKQLPCSHPALSYKSIWDDLSLDGENGKEILIYDGHRIVVPANLRQDVLAAMHKSHCGMEKTRQLAKSLYFWPGMSNDVAQTVQKCSMCVSRLPSLPDETFLQPRTTASGPMEAVGIDLFSLAGKNYLIMVDRYSGFPFCRLM